MLLIQPGSFGRSVIDLGRERELGFLAGSIAFFAFLSLIPGMLLVLTVGSFLGGEQFAGQVVGLVEGALSEEGSQVVEEALADTGGLASASAVTSIVLLWSALKVFRAIDLAFDRVYELDATTSLGEQIRNGLIAILAITAGVLAFIVVQILISILPIESGILATVLRWAISIPAIAVVLAPLYFVMPPRRVSFGEVIPGTLIAVLGLLALQQLFGLYAAQADQFDAYGFVGAVLLFLLWLYFAALILLSGAVVNAAILEDHDQNTELDDDPDSNTDETDTDTDDVDTDTDGSETDTDNARNTYVTNTEHTDADINGPETDRDRTPGGFPDGWTTNEPDSHRQIDETDTSNPSDRSHQSGSRENGE